MKFNVKEAETAAWGAYKTRHVKRGPTLKQQAAEEGITLRQLKRRLYKQRHPEEYAEQKKRERMNRPSRWAEWNETATPEQKEASRQKWREENPEKAHDTQRKAAKKWRRENREKHHAHRAVERAVAAGRLVRLPCAVCGNPVTEGHHTHGYSAENWFRVEWLCRQHHRERHE